MKGELWSIGEIDQFLKGYLMHGKDFSRIAASLRQKKLGQVIKFYYLFK